MPVTATQHSLKEMARMAFAALVIEFYKDAPMPDASKVEVMDDQKRELSDDIVGGIAVCRLEFAGSAYIGTVWQDKHQPKRVYARINQLLNSSGKHFPGIGKTLKNVPEDLIAARKKRTG